ncbi:hypothetical protein LINPERHAP2_LOCUS18857 [Linum perenne]
MSSSPNHSHESSDPWAAFLLHSSGSVIHHRSRITLTPASRQRQISRIQCNKTAISILIILGIKSSSSEASDSDVSRNLTPDAYEENYEFADPVGSFKGLTPLHEEQFYRNTFHPDRSLNELNKSMLELEDERSYISMRLK